MTHQRENTVAYFRSVQERHFAYYAMIGFSEIENFLVGTVLYA